MSDWNSLSNWLPFGFLHPELLLLALPAFWLWRRTRWGRIEVDVLRALILLSLILALASPHRVRRFEGRDVVVIADRSLSMPTEAEARTAEIMRLLADGRGDQDRLGLIAFGADAQVEFLPSEAAQFQNFQAPLNTSASDLGEALELGLNLVNSERASRLLVISDGESNGRDPLALARRSFGRSIPIDTLLLERSGRQDLAIESLDLPEEVAVGEPFQFTAWVSSDARTEADFVLTRGEKVIGQGRRVFEASGLSRILFRDVLREAGVATYRLELKAEETFGDRVPENNIALGAVQVRGARAVLVVNQDGAMGALPTIIEGAGIPVVVRTPEQAPRSLVGLTPFRAVVLENVPAQRLGGQRMRALDSFVRERGGGLLMTGGMASFGVGGYHLSALDELLPVSMEMRQESRKQALALAITMDRSGSMGAPVGGGLAKMDLANLGASAAVELLGPSDSVAIIAVDSATHVIQELTAVEDPVALTDRIRTIKSMGGGIFTYNALYAAGQELDKATQMTRHIILFADAADAEQPEGVPALLDQFERMNVTVSVIALGKESDSDAEFLKRIAAEGNGEVYFSTDPTDLPRLFAQDTLTVARSTFVEEPTGTRSLPDLFALGAMHGGSQSFASLDGYNLTYMRPGGVAGVVTTDDYKAPVLAYAYRGIGRTAAYAGQIGGRYGAPLLQWPDFAEFFVTLTRWLVGQEAPEGYFVSSWRDGHQMVISVEVDSTLETEAPAELTARLVDAGGQVGEHVLQRSGPNSYETRVDMNEAGVVLGTVRLGADRFLELPPATMPYAPEFEPSADSRSGERLMREISKLSGGEALAVASSVFKQSAESQRWGSFRREFVLLALCLLLIEIAVRRLDLQIPLGWQRRKAPLVREKQRNRGDYLPEGNATSRAAPTSVVPVAEPESEAAPTMSLQDAIRLAQRRAGEKTDR